MMKSSPIDHFLYHGDTLGGLRDVHIYFKCKKDSKNIYKSL